MKKINQILTAIILYCMISYILNLPNLIISLIITAIASQINIILPKNYRHSLILYIPMILFSFNYPFITIPVIIGYTSAIFIALLSKNGCKLLYPIRNMTFVGPKNYIENNSKKDYAITIFLIILALTTLILSANGEEIINSINNTDITHYLDSKNHTLPDNDKNYIQYINIDAEDCKNLNITTTQKDNTTTTIIKNYSE